MSIADIVVMVLIVAGALYLLYRSVWKKQGHCPGCDVSACPSSKSKKPGQCR